MSRPETTVSLSNRKEEYRVSATSENKSPDECLFGGVYNSLRALDVNALTEVGGIQKASNNLEDLFFIIAEDSPSAEMRELLSRFCRYLRGEESIALADIQVLRDRRFLEQLRSIQSGVSKGGIDWKLSLVLNNDLPNVASCSHGLFVDVVPVIEGVDPQSIPPTGVTERLDISPLIYLPNTEYTRRQREIVRNFICGFLDTLFYIKTASFKIEGETAGKDISVSLSFKDWLRFLKARSFRELKHREVHDIFTFYSTERVIFEGRIIEQNILPLELLQKIELLFRKSFAKKFSELFSSIDFSNQQSDLNSHWFLAFATWFYALLQTYKNEVMNPLSKTLMQQFK